MMLSPHHRSATISAAKRTKASVLRTEIVDRHEKTPGKARAPSRQGKSSGKRTAWPAARQGGHGAKRQARSEATGTERSDRHGAKRQARSEATSTERSDR